jgi:hypothetical protein
MVAAYKIVHGFINLLVLYPVDMLWIKTVTAKFQYLGLCITSHRNRVNTCTLASLLHCIPYVLFHGYPHCVSTHRKEQVFLRTPKWGYMKLYEIFVFFFSSRHHAAFTVTLWLLSFPAVWNHFSCLQLSLHNFCDCFVTGVLIWADVSKRATASNANMRHTLHIHALNLMAYKIVVAVTTLVVLTGRLVK